MMGAAEEQNQGGGGGIFDRMAFYFIRIIQILSILTILQFITSHSDYYNVIVFVAVIVAYFTIEWYKAKAKKEQPNQVPPEGEQSHINAPPVQWGVAGRAVAFLVEKAGLVMEVGVSFLMSLFPNWTI